MGTSVVLADRNLEQQLVVDRIDQHHTCQDIFLLDGLLHRPHGELEPLGARALQRGAVGSLGVGAASPLHHARRGVGVERHLIAVLIRVAVLRIAQHLVHVVLQVVARLREGVEPDLPCGFRLRYGHADLKHAPSERDQRRAAQPARQPKPNGLGELALVGVGLLIRLLERRERRVACLAVDDVPGPRVDAAGQEDVRVEPLLQEVVEHAVSKGRRPRPRGGVQLQGGIVDGQKQVALAGHEGGAHAWVHVLPLARRVQGARKGAASAGLHKRGEVRVYRVRPAHVSLGRVPLRRRGLLVAHVLERQRALDVVAEVPDETREVGGDELVHHGPLGHLLTYRVRHLCQGGDHALTGADPIGVLVEAHVRGRHVQQTLLPVLVREQGNGLLGQRDLQAVLAGGS